MWREKSFCEKKLLETFTITTKVLPKACGKTLSVMMCQFVLPGYKKWIYFLISLTFFPPQILWSIIQNKFIYHIDTFFNESGTVIVGRYQNSGPSSGTVDIKILSQVGHTQITFPIQPLLNPVYLFEFKKIRIDKQDTIIKAYGYLFKW